MHKFDTQTLALKKITRKCLTGVSIYYTGQQNEVTRKLQRRDLTFLKDFVSLITKIIIKKFSSEPFSRYSRFSRELGVFCGFIKIK